MAYTFLVDGVPLPITPSKVEIKHKSNNKTVNLINEGDVNLIKSPGLEEVTFTALLPRHRLPFISTNTHLDPFVYIAGFELLHSVNRVFQFIIIRTLPNGDPLVPTNLKCTLEDYSIVEDSNNGLDVEVKITLKKYKNYGLKKVKITEDSNGKQTASVETPRLSETAPSNKTVTVKKGDSLWNIAKKELGDGSKWKEIFNLNKDKISNPDLIYPDQKFTLPN